MPGFVFRKQDFFGTTIIAIHKLRSLYKFLHYANPIVCWNCVQILQEILNWVEDEIPAVARISRAIADASMWEENFDAVNWKVFFYSAVVLQRLLSVRANYIKKFEVVAGEDVRR